MEMRRKIKLDETEQLTRRVLKMAEEVQSGETDPIDIELSSSYQDLQEIVADIESKLGLDEVLNELLESKVTRVQEIARILQAPEYYVKKLRKLNARELAKLISYERPIRVTHLEPKTLQRALERMLLFKENITKELPEEEPPLMSEIPDDFKFESEDSVYIRDLELFLEGIQPNKEIPIEDLIADNNFEEFLKRFLYIVILISKGDLIFNSKKRTVERKE